MSVGVDNLLEQYESAAIRHGASSSPAVANAAAVVMADVRRALRSQGPDALSRLQPLLGHADASVRLWSASHLLDCMPNKAVLVLEDLAAGPVGATRATAGMTLREWRAGRLRLP